MAVVGFGPIVVAELLCFFGTRNEPSHMYLCKLYTAHTLSLKVLIVFISQYILKENISILFSSFVLLNNNSISWKQEFNWVGY